MRQHNVSPSRPAVVISGLGKQYSLRQRADFGGRLTERIAGAWRRRGRPFPDSDAREIWALRDVTLDIERGEAVGVIGRNGAGKTTLLKILARITPPTEGEVELRGRVGSLLEVGTGFHQDLTGRENVFLNGAILGMTRAEILRRFDAIVEFAEISRFLDTPVKRYSSGMYVRLAFAVAAHLEPDILLVDEVLSVGDASFRRRSLGRMNDVAKGGRTVVFVSHDLGSVARLTTKCVYLANGGVAAYGPTDQVIRGYLADIREHRARGRRRDLIPFRRDSLVDAPIHVVDVGMHEDKESISLGDPLEIEITLRVTRTVEALTVTIIIRDEEGRAAAVIHSPDQNFTVSANRGDCTIRVDCADLALAPGAYHIDVGVNQGGGTQAFDVVRDVPLFEIVNTGQVVEWLERPWGVVHPRRVTWEQVDH